MKRIGGCRAAFGPACCADHAGGCGGPGAGVPAELPAGRDPGPVLRSPAGHPPQQRQEGAVLSAGSAVLGDGVCAPVLGGPLSGERGSAAVYPGGLPGRRDPLSGHAQPLCAAGTAPNSGMAGKNRAVAGLSGGAGGKNGKKSLRKTKKRLPKLDEMV